MIKNSPQAPPLEIVLFHLIDESEETPITVIWDKEITELLMALSTDFVDELYNQGFGSHKGEYRHIGFVNESLSPAALSSTPSVPVQIDVSPYDIREMQ